MPTAEETLGCQEVDNISREIVEDTVGEIPCITRHSGFPACCLDPWVLQMSFFGYRQDGAILETDSPTR